MLGLTQPRTTDFPPVSTPTAGGKPTARGKLLAGGNLPPGGPRQVGNLSYALAALLALALSGCTSFRDYVHNGFKVGPNYCTPPAAVAPQWIDAADVHWQPCADLSRWWTVFDDPTLNHLIECAYRQNISLRVAGCRILEARAQLGIAQGRIFPQQQDAFGSYQRIGVSAATNVPAFGTRFFDQWNAGFSLAWELDFWGRFRRAIIAAEDQLQASVFDYDQVLVTLLGDVATNYVQVRTLQKRIELLRENVALQKWVVDLTELQSKVGARATQVDVGQTTSILEQTASQIPELEINLRVAENRLCVLLGVPPVDLQKMLGEGPIPTAKAEVVVGIPADLLRRRPDVRRAERLAAAQAQLIGIAEADLYPAFTINGTLGWQATRFSDLFSSRAFNGNIGPSFQWNILNYGRIINNVRFQDARFCELVAVYQQTVLQADEEVEDGMVTFLRAQRRKEHLGRSVAAAEKAVASIRQQFTAGIAKADFNRFALIAQNLVVQQDGDAQSLGEIAGGLIQVYRAMGGGWEIRCQGQGPSAPGAPAGPPPEQIPVPSGAPPAPPTTEIPKAPAPPVPPTAGPPMPSAVPPLPAVPKAK
jgi:NodT family efflux transporter outer membrane factor (OMF) lipoprotein